MGIFSSIKNAIFGKDEDTKAPPRPTGQTRAAAPKTAAPKTAQPKPVPMQEVDVEKRLDAMPDADKLNWRTSIVDLMKLIGVDASYENRKELATELGDKDYSGKAEENMWLHKRTMQELAKNGGKVPKQFLD